MAYCQPQVAHWLGSIQVRHAAYQSDPWNKGFLMKNDTIADAKRRKAKVEGHGEVALNKPSCFIA